MLTAGRTILNELRQADMIVKQKRRIRPSQVDYGREKMELPPKLGLGTLLGLLGQSLTYMGPHTQWRL